MKLIWCNACSDVVAMRMEPRTCFCGKSGGHYVNKLDAVFHGPATPLGFRNDDFGQALRNQPAAGEAWGKNFTAFVIEKECATFTEVPAPAKDFSWFRGGVDKELIKALVEREKANDRERTDQKAASPQTKRTRT